MHNCVSDTVSIQDYSESLYFKACDGKMRAKRRYRLVVAMIVKTFVGEIHKVHLKDFNQFKAILNLNDPVLNIPYQI